MHPAGDASDSKMDIEFGVGRFRELHGGSVAQGMGTFGGGGEDAAEAGA
mgnify:CR=1 FL=1